MNNQNYYPESQRGGNDGLCIASFVCGLVSFFLVDPLYAVSVAATVMGIIALCGKRQPKGFALAGLILGAVAFAIEVCVDIVLIPFTYGIAFLF